MNNSIVLISGGLDSIVSLGLAKEEYNITLGLTFDYGQKSAQQEIQAARKICSHYNETIPNIKGINLLNNLIHLIYTKISRDRIICVTYHCS